MKLRTVHLVADKKGDPGRRGGKVRVRAHRHEDDTDKIKDEDLPYGVPMFPVTSAATQKIGETAQLYPTGRALVAYLDEDVSEQYPIILGMLPRGDIDDQAKNKEQQDKETGGKINKPGPDNPGWAGKDSESDEAFPDGATVFLNQLLGQAAPKLEGKYPESPHLENDKGKKLDEVRKKFAKNADKPTTAAAQKGKDLPQAVQEVDPQNKAQVIPELYKQVNKMMNLLNMGSGASSGGGGQQQGQQPNSIPSGVSLVLNDSFTGALCILVRKYGFEEVIKIFTIALSNGGIDKISPLYKQTVINSLANLIRLALYFGPLNIPVSQYDETIFGDLVPSPVVELANVPSLYVKQYYTLDLDPYPGFDEWLSPDGKTKVWVKKAPKSFHFISSNQEIYSTSEREIAADLDPFFQFTIVNGVRVYFKILTAEELNKILLKQVVNIQTNNMDLNLGKNTGNDNPMNNQGGGGGGGNSFQSMISQVLQLLMQQFQTEQLPKSVLQQGEIGEVLKKFKQDMGINEEIFKIAKQVMGGNSLGGLGGLGGLGNILGGFDLGGLQGIMGGLMGGLQGMGGGSGGGGGGAGSGFSGFQDNGGNYNGGGLSLEGKQQLSTLLKLLGIQ